MKISFTGAQSTGKTTLLDKCRNQFPDFNYVDNITRDIKNAGEEINNTAEDYNQTQILILDKHLRNLRLRGDYILDRCMADGYVYTRYLYEQGKVNREIYNLSETLFYNYISKYDQIFYTDHVDVHLHHDGVRSTDSEFRDNIIRIYNDIKITEFSNVLKLEGPVPKRMSEIRKYLNNI